MINLLPHRIVCKNNIKTTRLQRFWFFITHLRGWFKYEVLKQ